MPADFPTLVSTPGSDLTRAVATGTRSTMSASGDDHAGKFSSSIHNGRIAWSPASSTQNETRSAPAAHCSTNVLACGGAFSIQLGSFMSELDHEEVSKLKRKYSSLLIQLDHLRSELTDVDLKFRPSNAEWSIKETLGHLVDTDQTIWGPRIQRLLAEENPVFDDIDQDALVQSNQWQDQSLEDILAQLMRVRWNYGIVINDLPESAFERIATHSAFGPLTLASILQILVSHDEHYLYRIRQLIVAAEQSKSIEF